MTKRINGLTNRGSFGEAGITNGDSFRDYEWRQNITIEAKRLQIRAGVSNRCRAKDAGLKTAFSYLNKVYEQINGVSM